jgi:hypothetical protein
MTKRNLPTKSTGKPKKSTTLVLRSNTGVSPDAATAALVVSGLAHNAVTTVQFSLPTFREIDLTECLTSLTATTGKVQDGNLQDVEAMLAGQAVALNAIFTEMARKAALNFGQYLDSAERYLRLARGRRPNAEPRPRRWPS